MKCSILLRLLALFFIAFIAGQILAFKLYQPQPHLSQTHRDAAAKILSLQISLAARMLEHNAIISSYLQTASSNVDVISSHVDTSVSQLFLLKDRIQNLPQVVLNVHFAVLAEKLNLDGEDGKEVIENSLENVKDSLALMEKEHDEMDLFIRHLSDEIMLLQEDILKDNKAKKEGVAPIKPTTEREDAPTVVQSLASSSMEEEKLLLEDLLKTDINEREVFSRVHSVIPEERPDNTITCTRYILIWNATLLFNENPCDYSCKSRVEVQFNKAVGSDGEEDFSYVYKKIEMNCTVSAPGQAKHAVGAHASEQGLLAFWFEQAPSTEQSRSPVAEQAKVDVGIEEL